MFGFEKKKLRLKSVEDFLRTQEIRTSDGPERKPSRAVGLLARIKPFAGPAFGILLILIVVAAALSQFNGLRSEITAIKDQKSDEAKELRRQVAELSIRIEKSENQAARLGENVAKLEETVETERLERIRAEEAAKKAREAALKRPRLPAKRVTPTVSRKATVPKSSGNPRQATVPFR
jgi:hypothetical protein